MRVLHLLKTSVGAAWAYRQTRELVSRGVEVHVALPADGTSPGGTPGGTLPDRYRAAGVLVHALQADFPVKRPWQLPRIADRLRRLVGEVAPDIVHSHFVGTTLTMRLALGRNHPTPRVFQVPGPLHLENPLFRAAEIATAGPRDCWIASCEWTRARYQRSGVAPERTFLAYYGQDLDEFAPAPPGALRRELGLGPDVPVVGLVAYMYAPKRYLGQRRGLKGHEDLIDALAIVRERRERRRRSGRRPDVVGVFAGGAWGDAAGYERRVRAYGAARLGDAAVFLGTRADVAAVYADLDVACHPSHSENVGGALESLALGVPTIATSVGGLPDVVKHGETGWLVPPHDPEALAAAIERALDDPEHARRLAAAGQALVRERMDVRRTAAAVHAAYQDILSRAPAARPNASRP